MAQNTRSATRSLLNYVRNYFEAPALAGMVTRQDAESVSLSTGVTIAVYPCVPSALRSIRACIVLLDEAAFFANSEGFMRDEEAFAAALPLTYSTDGRVIVLSSPDRPEGLLWRMVQKHWGVDSPTLVWRAGAGVMRTFDARAQAKADTLALEDPVRAASENDGDFRQGAAALLDPERLAQCVAPTNEEITPADREYVGFVDLNLGRKDKTALAIGHLEGARVVIDLLRSWSSASSRDEITIEVCQALKAYGCHEAIGDRVAGDWAVRDFARYGITLRQEAEPKATLYLALLAAVNRRGVMLPNDPTLLRQLRLLERRPRPSGRDWVDLPRGASEDEANVCAGVIWALTSGEPEHELGWVNLN
jgi:hypothetical protein